MKRRRELSNNMTTKRVLLTSNSRLLREMFRRVIDKTANLEIVQEFSDPQGLPSAIERFDPEWVIVFLPLSQSTHAYLNDCISGFPSVRFVFLSPDNSRVKMKWQTSYEEDLTNLSVKDFIHILEKDLQRTQI